MVQGSDAGEQRRPIRVRRAGRHTVQLCSWRQSSAWLRLYRKIAGHAAQHPRARGLRGNLTQAAESPLTPDRVLFERDSLRRLRAAPGQACVLPYFLEKLTDAR
ncbi:hypothetical protein A6V36_03460 [Paraburkholderia ginsengiterrae]|uniref:Uncharacterized protein n=1 Tax=Paraburkholderia ginsengiterrae TaxID=1462993 RepID=A0ABX2UTM1_9BURK|nr:hypothetical protein A6V36_03460 [Paraburkholderia ginsengiterrae]